MPSPSVSGRLVAPVQVPALHASPSVQSLPSSQGVPSGRAAAKEHAPVAGSQTPASWHWSPSSQTTGSSPVQLPAWQVSLRVHASPSLHGAPSALAGSEQLPLAGSHTPAL